MERELQSTQHGRRTSGALLQPALMEYGDATNEYSNSDDRHYSPSRAEDRDAGLYLDQMLRLREGLFGTPGYMITASNDRNPRDPESAERGQEQHVRSRVLDERGVVDMTRATNLTPEAALRSAVLQNKRVSFAMITPLGGGHACVFESFGTDGRVYFYNPWGAVTNPESLEILATEWPALRVESTTTGLQSLPQKDFFECVFGVVW
ncbi:MAG: hypothetical protein H0T42_20290 [Deltaproteobacteria bacterium]|nr:hypothetical protein [Deltaproteobacteria bacterium]